MDSHTELIILSFRHMQAFAFTDACIDAVGLAARRAIIACADDDLILDDDGAITAAQAGRTASHSSRDIQKIFRPVRTLLFLIHDNSPLYTASLI